MTDAINFQIEMQALGFKKVDSEKPSAHANWEPLPGVEKTMVMFGNGYALSIITTSPQPYFEAAILMLSKRYGKPVYVILFEHVYHNITLTDVRILLTMVESLPKAQE